MGQAKVTQKSSRLRRSRQHTRESLAASAPSALGGGGGGGSSNQDIVPPKSPLLFSVSSSASASAAAAQRRGGGGLLGEAFAPHSLALWLYVAAPTGLFVDLSLGDGNTVVMHVVNVGVVNSKPIRLVATLNRDLVNLGIPMGVYNVVSPDDSAFMGYGFIPRYGSTAVHGPSLTVKYSTTPDITTTIPHIAFRGEHFSIYHATNVATLITVPTIPKMVEELINLV